VRGAGGLRRLDEFGEIGIALPLYVSAAGILASVVGTAFVRTSENASQADLLKCAPVPPPAHVPQPPHLSQETATWPACPAFLPAVAFFV
jgi:hypothetical protein